MCLGLLRVHREGYDDGEKEEKDSLHDCDFLYNGNGVFFREAARGTLRASSSCVERKRDFFLSRCERLVVILSALRNRFLMKLKQE